MRRLVFIYARSDSSRLPGKQMMKLAGHTVIDIVIRRARRVGADGCVVLTTKRRVDNALAAHCEKQGIEVVRGHSTNLVKRSIQAMRETGATYFLRVNGDSPLFEPEMARYAMRYIEDARMITNLVERRFPYGVAVEWINAEFYGERAKYASEVELEHVTQHLYGSLDFEGTLSLTQARDDSGMRLTLDTLEDHVRLTEFIGDHDPCNAAYWEIDGRPKPAMFVESLSR